jgi:hypothetical protein
LLIGISFSESQGLAWAEAWSTNVPTFLYKSNQNIYEGRIFKCSSAPYLSEKTGAFFEDLSEFKLLMNLWVNDLVNFEPREWVIENMSDNICATKLLERSIYA